MPDKITLGFIGTGKMGKPMVLRLLDAGQRVVVYNRTAAKLEELGAAGARIAGTPAEVTANADMVLLCLTDGIAVEQVVLGAQGIVKSAREEKTGDRFFQYIASGHSTNCTGIAAEIGYALDRCPGIGGCKWSATGQAGDHVRWRRG